MDKIVKVNFRNLETKEFAVGTSLLEVSKSFAHYFNYPVLVAVVDNNIQELSDVLTKKCDIDFYDRSNGAGNSIYGRSLQFMLVVAVKRVLGKDADVTIEHSIDKGFYCEIHGADVDRSTITDVNNEMKNIVKEDLVFTKLSVARIEAIKFFKQNHQDDKVKVLKYISNTYINLYRLDDVYDYYYSSLAYSTGQIDEFKVTYIKDNGFVVSYPDIYDPDETIEYVHHKMMFDKFLEYTKWGRDIEINNAADLNEVVSLGNYNELIRVSEAAFNSQLAEVAGHISDNRKNIKIVLIAGPSSSGKTTTSYRLSTYLESRGIRAHHISLDDYFVNRKYTPKDRNGEFDFESIKALDLELLNQQLVKLIDGDKVLLPEYNFKTGEREYHKNYIQLKDNDIVIIEGLHGLNEELTSAIDRKNKYKIYVSPLTQLNIDNHNRIHTSDTRKLRRIVRDNKYRNYSAADTLNSWKKVREGEEKWIFPYQDQADYIINTALIYELGVLKTYAEPLLFSVPEDDPQYAEALRLINFLRNFLPIPSDEVPGDSILREFIGGSCFHD
jgi:uridine kinase